MKPQETAYLNGKKHQRVVFLIHTKNPDGSPALLKMMRDRDVIDLAGGEEFMTAFVPSVMLNPGPLPPPSDN
jgi:hypothetical protein